MDTIELLVNGWPFALFMLIYFGSRVVERNPRCRELGKKISVWSFVLSFLYLMFAPNRDNTPSPNLIGAAVVSLILAGMVLGSSWLVLSPVLFAYDSTLGAAFRSWKRLASASRQRRLQQRQNSEWERSRPERERESARRVNAQKRREDARAECDALYSFAAPEIASRFSKQDFAEFVSKYMTDAIPPEVVEERGEQLKGIIRHHWERIEPPRRTLKELSEWFEQRMTELESVPDERLRKTLIVQLKVRYSDLTSAMLSEMSP